MAELLNYPSQPLFDMTFLDPSSQHCRGIQLRAGVTLTPALGVNTQYCQEPGVIIQAGL